MILRTLEVDTFAGLAGRTVELRDGVNVVLGPNEAGKSSLFQALQHVLLTPSRLGKRELAALSPFFPASGGDTIGVELRFTERGAPYRLRRRWGRTPSVELELPDGGRLTAEDAVGARLADLLPAAEGTLRSVLLTWQSGLGGTLEELRRDGDTVHSLSDLLRRAFLSMDGVSASRYREMVEKRIDSLYSHWDRELDRPEGGRRGDHRWKREVGELLARWYEWQDLEEAYGEAKRREDRYAEAALRLEKAERAAAEGKAFTAKHARAFQDAQRRRALEAERREAEREVTSLKAAYERWPRAQHERDERAARLPGLQARLEELKAERLAAEAADRHRELLSRFERVERKRAALQAAEQALAAAAAPERRDLEGLRRLREDLERREAALAGGRIRLELEAREALTVRMAVDGGTETERKVERGERLSTEGGGHLRLEHPGWSLEVCSGEGDARAAAAGLARARRALEEALAALGAASLGEAEQRYARREETRLAVKHARAAFEAELEGSDYEGLAREAREAGAQAGAGGAAGAAAPPRGAAVVVEELVRAEKAWEECRRQGEAAGRELGELRAVHTDSDALLEKIVAARAVQQRLAAEAEALAPLPEGYADAERFLREYREREQGLGALQENLDAARREYYQAEADQPEAASEETRELKEEAERAWAGVRRRGRALERILLAVDGLLAEQDGKEGNGYGEEMARHVGRMTGGRYRRVRMAGALPDALLRGDETPLAYELLSGGTKDVFSLGLRLAMAGWFLQGKEGFLVMDDPLVELDPGRQRLAAEALAGFCGADRQLVLFTCHPSHAALFDGANRIELG